MCDLLSTPDGHFYSDGDEGPEQYVQRPRILVANLPKHIGVSQFRNLINRHKLKGAKKVRLTKNAGWLTVRNVLFYEFLPPADEALGFVSFDNEEEHGKALKVLDKTTFKGRVLRASNAPEKRGNFRSNRQQKGWRSFIVHGKLFILQAMTARVQRQCMKRYSPMRICRTKSKRSARTKTASFS